MRNGIKFWRIKEDLKLLSREVRIANRNIFRSLRNARKFKRPRYYSAKYSSPKYYPSRNTGYRKIKYANRHGMLKRAFAVFLIGSGIFAAGYVKSLWDTRDTINDGIRTKIIIDSAEKFKNEVDGVDKKDKKGWIDNLIENLLD